jgi:hypothetical protein
MLIFQILLIFYSLWNKVSYHKNDENIVNYHLISYPANSRLKQEEKLTQDTLLQINIFLKTNENFENLKFEINQTSTSCLSI